MNWIEITFFSSLQTLADSINSILNLCFTSDVENVNFLLGLKHGKPWRSRQKEQLELRRDSDCEQLFGLRWSSRTLAIGNGWGNVKRSTIKVLLSSLCNCLIKSSERGLLSTFSYLINCTTTLLWECSFSFPKFKFFTRAGEEPNRNATKVVRWNYLHW